MLEAVLAAAAKDIQPARVVGNGGKPIRTKPMRIETLFVQFSKIETPEDVLRFVQTHGSLTRKGKGDVVEEVIAEARDMRGRVRKALGRLIVSIDTTGDQTRLKVRPACLLDAIWLQYAQANTRSQECLQCGERFLVGAEAGKRADAKYCSTECRVRFLSLKRSRR